MGFPDLFKEVGQGSPVGLNFFQNKVVILDGYNFVFRMAHELAVPVLVRHDTDLIIRKFRWLVDQLVRVCSFVYLVWDGDIVPCKAITSVERRIKRDALCQEGLKEYEKKNYAEARRLLKKGFHVPQDVMNGLKEALNKIFSKTNRFCCFTSPYEADQQMAYMYYHRRVDVVLSADSDMLFYNVPFVRDWDPARRCGSYYPQDYLKKYLAGLPHPLPVEDYLILKIIKNGCDFFPYGAGARYRGGKFSFVFSDCRRYVTKDRFVQTLVHALY